MTDQPVLVVEFCGERHEVTADRSFSIGREADLSVDDNPYLHRRFLTVSAAKGMWWLSNVGTQLNATVSDEHGRLEAWLAPGAQLPLVFARTSVRFTAGPTSYEVDIVQPEPVFVDAPAPTAKDGLTTVGRATLTPSQMLLVLALAEPALRLEGRGASALPTSAEAAARLGWAMTRFNRKLDNVCQRLERQGVRGLHGGPDRLAANRRARLVEYALAVRLVTKSDLPLLDRARANDADDGAE